MGQVKVEICVEYWCTGDFHAANGVDTIPGRGQIKLRPLLFNKSPFAVDISISPNAAIRLLVVTPKDPSVWWQPPPVTSQAGDRPVPIKWNGQDTWAVPPNAPHDAVRIDLPGNMYTYDGFATFWDFTMLAPGETAFKPLRFDDQHHAIQEGDLVFNVPLDDQRASTARALVLVDRNDPTKILASSDTTTWPRPSDLNSF
ncbi:hypothetical protein A5789_05850 [Nocardia sp. 852002-51101_SCH5132738]|nr:hypothetical protein A5789_05850 [Nocardia sp. 852002-51101_SCH5132738]OBB38592.1 hypothetical protein A5748_02755 [Nocardia sp. 852002-51244_SCH5132740]OBF82932.1 hypothetical protein A9X06_18370 [Mycobacterium sp. 852002-51759_SCH5129042]